MRTKLMILLVLVCSIPARANTQSAILEHIIHNDLIQLPSTLDCDTTLRIKEFTVRIVRRQGKIDQIGLHLFNDDIKTTVDKQLLNFVEEALLAKALNIKTDQYDKVIINRGSLEDFKSLSTQSDFLINTVDSKFITIEWPLNSRCVSVALPNNYDTFHSGSRTDLENDFIEKLKSFKGSRIPFEPIDTFRLEPYGEDKLIYPGDSYLNDHINRNIYLCIENLTPVNDSLSPIESLANLFIFPSENADAVNMELTILKHEYGEKETFCLGVNQLLAACEDDGCVPYWGVEKYENGILHGSLFLYNKHRSYDHVIKIECNPEAIFNNKEIIRARVSCFIPTNNIHNLFAPNVEKSENEKIRYNQ